MSILSKLGDAFSGRTEHINNNEMTVINKLWEEANILPKPFDFIYQQFIAESGMCLDFLLGINNSPKNELIKIDLFKINKNNFEDLFSVLIAYFTIKFITINSFLKDDSLKYLFEIVPNKKLAKEIMENVDDNLKNQIGEDLIRQSNVVWKKIANICGIEENNPGGMVSFGYFMNNTFITTLKNIRKEIDSK